MQTKDRIISKKEIKDVILIIFITGILLLLALALDVNHHFTNLWFWD
ncbi:MAG: hypothetical protein ACTSPM_04460 [Candidatus Heimdallarchaeota archaeon]